MYRGAGLRIAAAMFLLGPAAIHFAVAPEHLREYAPYGVFFVLLGLAQAALAAGTLIRPSPPVLLGGAFLSLFVIGIWLLSRTAGLPVARIPWQPEAVGLPDLLSTLMEWMAACLLVLADFRLNSSRRFSVGRAAPGLAVSAVACVALTMAGLAGVGVAGGH